MAIDRVTINLPEGMSRVLDKRATSQKRSISNYVAVLIENDLRAAGIEINGGDEKTAEILDAAKEIGEDRALAVLRKASRSRRSLAET